LEEEGRNEMQVLLQQLRDEPGDEADSAAKFGLFEKYLETVEKMRQATFQFWEEANGDFPDGPKVLRLSVTFLDLEPSRSGLNPVYSTRVRCNAPYTRLTMKTTWASSLLRLLIKPLLKP
jgi:hypothetical protein